MSKIIHRAFELRQKGDYMEQVEIIIEDVNEIFPEAINFVNNIKSYLLNK
jgi:uncharacterized protein (UPF0332 family)